MTTNWTLTSNLDPHYPTRMIKGTNKCVCSEPNLVLGNYILSEVCEANEGVR